MSVLIRNMDMPKSCDDCPCNDGEYCYCLHDDNTDYFKRLNRGKPLKDCPLIEVPEQKHGKWKKAYLDHEAFGIRPTVVYCSECNLVGYWEPNYCPNCGARMDGE